MFTKLYYALQSYESASKRVSEKLVDQPAVGDIHGKSPSTGRVADQMIVSMIPKSPPGSSGDQMSPCLGKTPLGGVLPYCHRLRRPASSLSLSLLFVQSEAVVYLEKGLI